MKTSIKESAVFYVPFAYFLADSNLNTNLLPDNTTGQGGECLSYKRQSFNSSIDANYFPVDGAELSSCLEVSQNLTL
jgi:hypothetical protein